MKKLRTVIVDDEELARRLLHSSLSKIAEIEIIAECEDGISAIEQIELRKPDLVFIDIQMPELDGFDVIDNLQIQPLPLFIFITAYDEFALQAFQKHAVDYLLKPVKEDHFIKAVERARLLIHAKNNPQYRYQPR